MPTDLGRVPHTREDGRRVERKLLRCDCGEEVLCAQFTNTCSCGADYNLSGQRLGPRAFWGEETGESPDDVVSLTGEETDPW